MSRPVVEYDAHFRLIGRTWIDVAQALPSFQRATHDSPNGFVRTAEGHAV